MLQGTRSTPQPLQQELPPQTLQPELLQVATEALDSMQSTPNSIATTNRSQRIIASTPGVSSESFGVCGLV